jgi:4-hydroxybenzoate polyprenyltransferase
VVPDGGTVSGIVQARSDWRDWIHLARPQQWIKNGFVLAPLLFSGRVRDPEAIGLAAVAFLAFCLSASAVYAMNDVVDRISDQAHPTKRHRPIAAGRVAAPTALGMGITLALVAIAIAWTIDRTMILGVVAYLGLNRLYTFWLKHLVILDVFAIAVFFLLRLLGGAVAIEVTASIWLILCGGLLALFLGFAKRRHELLLLGHESADHRSVLSEYSTVFLDQMSTVLLSVTVVTYIMYTVSADKVVEIGSHALVYSTAFVLYGVFRYLYLVHHRDGGSPTETLLTDRALLVNVVLWVLYCGWVIYRPI